MEKNVHNHSLRHLWATSMLDHNVPLERIQLCMGHSDISVTTRYAKIRNERGSKRNNGHRGVLMRENKYIILIVGKSGSGKSTICDRLEQEYGLNQVKSYTTRPRRGANEWTYICKR